MTSQKEEKLFSVKEGTLAYFEYDDFIGIKRYRGIGEFVEIPAKIDGIPVKEISKKAFLSCKTLKEIVLPDTIEEIGDWAFAHAEKLRKVTIPKANFKKGKEIFLGCMRLREINIAGTNEEMEQNRKDGINRMLAFSVTALHDYFLFSPLEVRNQEWFTKWDEKLCQFLQIDDLEGYEELWTCGEEDYEGKEYDIKSYPVEKRKSKIRLAYFRLLHETGLSQETKQFLQTYLKSHTKGMKEPEAWDIIKEEHVEDIAYYQIFAEAGCIQEDNFEALLQDIQHANAQIKGFLLKYKDEKLAPKDAFSDFSLDW